MDGPERIDKKKKKKEKNDEIQNCFKMKESNLNVIV